MPKPARLLPALAVAAACALVTAPAHGQGSRVRIGIIGHPGPVAVDSMATIVSIDAPVAPTFSAVAKVFTDDLKIAIDTRDSLRGMVGVMSIARMRTFANARLSRFLNCGSSLTGLNADNWRVYVTAFAFVDRGDSTHTTLRVAMIGGARDVAGTSTEPVACGTTGAFEELVTARVRERLQLPAR